MATFRSRSLKKFFLLWSLRFVYVTRQRFNLECAMKQLDMKKESISYPKFEGKILKPPVIYYLCHVLPEACNIFHVISC